jgi:hypothetical protein
MMGFKVFHSAKATLDEIETAHMIRKGAAIQGKPARLQVVYGFSRIILFAD